MAEHYLNLIKKTVPRLQTGVSFKRSCGMSKVRNRSWVFQNYFAARFLSSKLCKDGETVEMKVEIISKENIKPESPTPQHSRTYKVSILDQLNPHFYVPSLYFYQNNSSPLSISEKCKILKQSLSKTLVRFFPFAGKVIDNQHIECSDDGVYYIEVRVSNHPSELLSDPSSKFLHQLFPFHPKSERAILYSQNYIVMIPVNVFDCGGIAIGIYSTHKIIDGYSHMTFMKAWAATARGSPEQISPNYISPSLFLPNPTLPQHISMVVWPSQAEKGNYVTRRFRFDASALASLKAKACPSSSSGSNPSRLLAVTGLIWKCILSAYRARSGSRKPSVLNLPVNLRNRASPTLPPYSIGNIYWPTIARWPDQSLQNNDVELHSIVKSLKDAIARTNSNFVEEIKGEKGSVKVIEKWEELAKLHSSIEVPHSIIVSSLCNVGLCDVDFGWGKPLWTCAPYNDPEFQVDSNLVHLYDTRSGDGIEAWVTLNKEDMDIFENDTELLSFASMNPSPLQS